jgi:predicted metal-dependent enzyme (double-stranded beta helix superfamily)
VTSATKPLNPKRFEDFIRHMTALVESLGDDEPALLDAAEPLLGDLIRNDDWLPERFARPSEQSYRQYLLYCDPMQRFSVLSFVWQPGQMTPVHDHTVWGLVGVMRGEERCEEYVATGGGRLPRKSGEHALPCGAIDRVSPRIGDVHRVSNAGRGTAISIHVYGADIGTTTRHVFDESTGAVKDFVSGYNNGEQAPLLVATKAR